MKGAVTIHVCPDRHAFFVAHDACPRCDAPLAAAEAAPDARLVAHTTVHVGPHDEPFVLGVAEVAAGARTLCIVEGAVTERVVLSLRDGLYYAHTR